MEHIEDGNERPFFLSFFLFPLFLCTKENTVGIDGAENYIEK